MRWMLDTNTCIDVMKQHPPAVQERLRRVAVGEVGIQRFAPTWNRRVDPSDRTTC